MSEHTKGPWTASYNQTLECWQVEVPYDSIHCPVMFEGNEADSKLIAAAPELLELLESALQEHINYENGERVYDKWIPFAKELIAKAKGDR